MIDTLRSPLAAVLLVVALGGFGCGSGDGDTGPTGPTEQAALEDFSAMLKSISDQNKRPPAKLTDLDAYEPIHMAAYRGVASKAVVYFWGTGLVPGGTAVIAYDAKAETAGGHVLLQDGTVKEMTAAEFAAAPKAKK